MRRFYVTVLFYVGDAHIIRVALDMISELEQGSGGSHKVCSPRQSR
jgi:hypothetical protein